MRKGCRWLPILFLSLGITGEAGAATTAVSAPTPKQFAYGLHLETQSERGIYELELPLVVYQGVTRADLGDLRVFNRAGKVVPHALRAAERPRPETVETKKDLAFFPIHGRIGQRLGGVALHIERRGEGQQATIVDVRVDGEEPGESPSTIGYLVEVWGDKGPPLFMQPQAAGSPYGREFHQVARGGAASSEKSLTALNLSWSAADGDIVEHLSVESSDDLADWEQLASGTIADLHFQGHRLRRDTISLGRSNARYLRLSWPPDRSPPALNLVRGVFEFLRPSVETVSYWHRAEFRTEGGNKGNYLFDLEGNLPVSRVRIKLAEKNSLQLASLFSRPTPAVPWQNRWQDLLYDLEINGEGFSNPEISLSSTSHRYWLLRIENGETGPVSQPSVEFQWHPARLLFIAQGEGPFLLAYGSAVTEPGSFGVDQLLERYQSSMGRLVLPDGIGAGSPFVLGGPSRLLPPPPPLPWRTYILWGVLVVGVGLIGAMARHLYRQLQEAADERQ